MARGKRRQNSSPPAPMGSDAWDRIAIDEVASGRTTTLDLRDLETPSHRITELPSEVRGLRNLTELRLGDTRLTGLPDWLCELPRLELVDARSVRLTTLPALPRARWALNAETVRTCADHIDPRAIFSVRVDPKTSDTALRHLVRLTQERAMTLSILTVGGTITLANRDRTAAQWTDLERLETHLDALLRGQPDLDHVLIWGCPLGRVPQGLAALRKLHVLALIAVYPDHLPDWLFSFPELRTLGLSHNNLKDLPTAIAKARTLDSLDLSNNPFRRVPEGVWDLSNLRTLSLDDCPISEVPAAILRLEKLEDLSLGSPFERQATPPKGLVRPPPEIAIHGVEAIKNYWRQQQAVGVDYLAEAKLLIVGEPGAGKTTLAKKLLDPGYVLDSGEQSTEGIDVSTWEFPSAIRVQSDGSEDLLRCTFRANIWDFGGQEIYHATHQFFLTRRSVYVLVTDERREDTDFEYWLEVVNLLSDGSPVLIVQNQKQGRHQGIDFSDLRRRYPNLRPPLTLNLADRRSLKPAVQRIRAELEQLPHIGTPCRRRGVTSGWRSSPTPATT
ncbi:leucine-rich repeat domain-containing protein [Blastococcus sp. PRF04-17]|uniref:leucine-rich repeat domain-containing protein n=1 Tax=Blastococcus sp. PRF04-17 TaxID=2933797 RepID=UPI001FF283BF|nr:hypothetical protein [Blastococcus sp. PRF04-17]UOY02815.1 hypothetical protein MVA48_05500 [Blastococcus sp. PRF04-17]